jgi:hypothetical protein
MALLHLALQEGFDDDEVSVTVEGEQVLHRTGVSTRTQIGLAERVDVTVERGRRTVRVSVRGRSASVDVEIEDEIYVGISLDRSGAIEHRVSREPFRYL